MRLPVCLLLAAIAACGEPSAESVTVVDEYGFLPAGYVAGPYLDNWPPGWEHYGQQDGPYILPWLTEGDSVFFELQPYGEDWLSQVGDDPEFTIAARSSDPSVIRVWNDSVMEVAYGTDTTFYRTVGMKAVAPGRAEVSVRAETATRRTGWWFLDNGNWGQIGSNSPDDPEGLVWGDGVIQVFDRETAGAFGVTLSRDPEPELCRTGIYFVLESSPDIVRSRDPKTGGTTQSVLKIDWPDMSTETKHEIACVTTEIGDEYDAHRTSERWHLLVARVQRLYDSSADYRAWFEQQARGSQRGSN